MDEREQFGGATRISETGISKTDWHRLCRTCCPGMHLATMNSLFVTMDVNRDGKAQRAEIFEERMLAILQTRFNHFADVHPLEGAYMCLPNPPFERDDAQVACIRQLKIVWDGDVARWHASPMETAEPEDSDTMSTAGVGSMSLPMPNFSNFSLSSLGESIGSSLGSLSAFGGSLGSVSDATDVAKKPKVITPTAPKGLYLYGMSGCGKTALLDMFLRSLPEDFPVIRLHWYEFQRDAFRLTSMTNLIPTANIFDESAKHIAASCKLLLLDDIRVTSLIDAQTFKELIRHLWAHGVTTIFTSSSMPENLYQGVDTLGFAKFIPDLRQQGPVFDFSQYKQVDY